MKKEKYSHYCYQLKRHYKKNKNWPFEMFRKQVMIHAAEQKDLILSVFIMENEIIDGNCQHVFIQDDLLFDFLSNSDIKITSTLESFIEYYPFKKNVSEEFYLTDFNLVVHHKKHDKSFLLGCILNKKDNNFTIVINPNSDLDGWMRNDQKPNSKIISYSNIFNNKDKKIFNLLFNVIFYARAFPDKVIDGVPVDYKDVGLNSNNNKNSFYLKPHESIINSSHVTPHFRKGHFVELKSERYVNKKGAVIWRNSSMVKGFNAKTEII